MDAERLLSSREVAALLGVSSLTVSRMAQRAEIPARKIAGRYRYRLSEIERWIEDCSPKPHPAQIDVIGLLHDIRGELQEVRELLAIDRIDAHS